MKPALETAPESLFWYWISERHAIYLKRSQGEPKPWTTDPILRDYKFTNPFRENDRGTVWLRENFLEPHHDGDLSLVAFNICWYRMFNWTGTGEYLGWQTDWNPEEIKHRLRARLDTGQQVFTGAHIIYSPPGKPKIDAIVDVCQDLYHLCVRGLPRYAAETRSLQAVYTKLREVPCVGGFMAYEMVTDMRHTRLLEAATDIMTWANLGPGAKRGLQRLQLTDRPEGAAIEEMRRLLNRSAAGLPSGFPALEMRDIEHSLCEFDKYCRVKFREGEPRSKFNGAA